MKRENPGLSPGAPELSLILGSGPYGGVSGDGVPCSQRTNSSNISVGGWGCYPVRLTATFRAGALPYFHYAFGQRIRYFGIRTTTPLLLEVRPQMPSPRENGNQLGSSPRPSACRAIPSPCPPVSFGCSARVRLARCLRCAELRIARGQSGERLDQRLIARGLLRWRRRCR